jgi:hypothetical protein
VREKKLTCLQVIWRSCIIKKKRRGEVTDEQGYYHVYNGKVVAERYKIIDKIGRGVFGVVAKVEDQKEEGKNFGPEDFEKELSYCCKWIERV